MKQEFDLTGTLMNRNTELARFIIEKGRAVLFEQLCSDRWKFPFDMEIYQNGTTLINTLLVRVVPETRQGLLEDLARVGIYGYDLSAILRYQNASSVEDTFWVRFDGEGPQTWEQLRAKIGYIDVSCTGK